MTNPEEIKYDYDYIVIGSGFGGSVSAMRLSQKGYRVAILEAGKRWHADEFPKSNMNIWKYLWFPKVFCYGIQRMNLLRNVFILSAAGVGGGSLNYANTLYVPPDIFFTRDSIKRIGGKKGLLPYYDIASKMLGAAENPVLTKQDELLKLTADETGRGETFKPTTVAVFFGKEGIPQPDPFFEGEGPDRIGCELCGECMTGCKRNAKNTLDKNYLYFAQKFGTEIIPENKVIDIRPLSADGSSGYEITTSKITELFGAFRGKRLKAKGIVISAGTLGTLSLLLKMKQKKRLPNLPDTIGKYVRTNSEDIIGVKSKNKDVDFTRGVAITSSVYPDDETHIEPVRYGLGHDLLSGISSLMTNGGGVFPRPLKFFMIIITNPLNFLRVLYPFGWARKSLLLLVMQTVDNYLIIKRKRRLIWPFSKSLTSVYGTEKRNPTWIPVAYDFTRRLAKRINGIAMNVITLNLMSAPITAHIMGGCSIGPVPEEGVIDEENHVKGYKHMIICDGSQIPENLGVNPALSITAFSERAMSFIQPKNGNIRYLKADKRWEASKSLLQKSRHEKIAAY